MGCSRKTIWHLCSWSLFTCVFAFNLDTENVIIKSGDEGSLFGFSLAMHRQLNPDKRHLLVGAPKALGLGAQASTTSGGLYTCDINDPGSACDRVSFDDKLDREKESKDNQWLGVVVQSQGPGGKVLTCAHRYQERLFVGTQQESRDITGRCFMLAEDLTIDPNGRDGEGDQWKFCSGRPRGHEQFGTCQQGMSATFTKDYHYLIFGAPGAYNWKGVVRVEQKNDTLFDMDIFNDGPYEVGDEAAFDESKVPVPANSYLGFSLDSGKAITKKGQLTVVAGAPRANHSGAVVFFKIVPETKAMSKEHVLDGEGLASSFGYDLAVVDLNADGWQDIVVGAPQYFEKDKELGGAIYVYINKKGQWKNVKPQRIVGTKNSMFGLSVENIGDVNLDGYGDIAVGAPYEDDGAGKVYIYHGSAEGMNSTPAQVLSGKGQGVKLFGYSMAGNMDLDLNFYPDLAIGSLSDSVYVYRARPVINLKKEVMTSPKELDLTKKNCGNSICLEVEACFLYTAKPKSLNPKIVVKYMFQTEMERRKQGLPSRVTFSSGAEYESTGTVELAGQDKRKCFKKELRLKENIRDKLRGIPIEISVEIVEGGRNRRQLPGLAPILDSTQPASVFTEVSFVKEGCGSDNKCQSNLDIKYEFCSREPNKDIFHPLPRDGNLQLISLSNQKEIALKVTVTNKGGDDAYEAGLIASFPPTLSYSATRAASADKPVICTANTNGSQADCELGNPFKRDAEVTFYIVLTTGGISLNTTEVEIDLKLETTSQQQEAQSQVKARANVVIELLLSVTGAAKPSQVYFSGDIKGESAMKSEADIGTMIEYEFRVINLGKPLQSYGTAALTIHWPKHNDKGKYILYLMSVTSDGLERQTCSNLQAVNPLGLKEVALTRSKREIASQEMAEEGTIALLTDKRKNKTLSCGHEADCIDIKCPLQGMKSNAIIKLRARLWNSTFLEDYSTQNYLNVLVKATLSLDGRASNIRLKDTDATASVTVFPERRVAQYGGLPWWIILVAILLGLLLLALLIFLLWKCGFFGNKDDDSSEKEKLTSEA